MPPHRPFSAHRASDEELVKVCPENDEYKMNYAQSLYKAALYPEATRAAVRVDNPQYAQKMTMLQATIKYESDVLKHKLFSDVTDMYLFDSKGYEKSESFDHNLIKNIKLNKELMLAGNIKFDDNLKNYEKIANYLDLSGGLETSGLKDTSKIDIFLKNINKLKK